LGSEKGKRPKKWEKQNKKTRKEKWFKQKTPPEKKEQDDTVSGPEGEKGPGSCQESKKVTRQRATNLWKNEKNIRPKKKKREG